MTKLLTNLWAGMGTLLVDMPSPISRRDLQLRRRRPAADLKALRGDVQRVAAGMRRASRKAEKNG